MPAIKALDRIGEKWSRVTQQATADYQAGVQNPKSDWAEKTSGADKNYAAGVQAAISRGSFAKGVKKAGTEKWKTNALEKGAPRFSTGVALARQAYETGFAPYRQVIQNLNLPARGPKGDPGNIQRVAVLAKALRDTKLARLGA